MTALAKVLALCAGTVGGAAACVATGVVPAPLIDPPTHHAAPPAKVAHHHRRLAEELEEGSSSYEPALPSETSEAAVEPEPEPQPKEAAPPPEEAHEEKKEPEPRAPEREEAPIEEAIAETAPSESGATEFTEAPPEPVVTEAPSTLLRPVVLEQRRLLGLVVERHRRRGVRTVSAAGRPVPRAARLAAIALAALALLGGVLSAAARASDGTLLTGLHIYGGEIWHADNEFRVEWDPNPPTPFRSDVKYGLRAMGGYYLPGFPDQTVENPVSAVLVRVPPTPGIYWVEAWDHHPDDIYPERRPLLRAPLVRRCAAAVPVGVGPRLGRRGLPRADPRRPADRAPPDLRRDRLRGLGRRGAERLALRPRRPLRGE